MKPPITGRLDVERLRMDFPILLREITPGNRLVYLDSTATTQKPLDVLQAMDDYYRRSNANIHRGVHTLAEEATALYENARERIAEFIGARKSCEVIFTRNATEAINLVAFSWGRKNLAPGDLIILTEMEHHSNLVPWQMLAQEIGLKLEFIPVTDDGLLDLTVFKQLIARQPKLVTFTHMSNVLGTVNPATEIIRLAHAVGAVVLVDGAQSVPHLPVNVQELDMDFLVFSAHKMLGPTGIGALYGKESLLDRMPPYQGGGDMIKKVYLRTFTANDLPHKFEAGTPAVAEAVGFGAAVDYLAQIGMDAVANHEHDIIGYALEVLSEVDGLRVYGPPANQKGAVAAFTLQGVHPHDISQILDREGIAVRAGHHCAMPLHDKLGLPATTRASFYLYNTWEEVDRLAAGLATVKKIFG